MINPLSRLVSHQWFWRLLLLGLCLLLASCGSSRKKITGIPPQVLLSEVQVVEDTLRLSLRFRNGNDQQLTGNNLSFQFFVDEYLAAEYQGNPVIDVLANSAEELILEVPVASLDALAILDELDDSQTVRWRMQGNLLLDQKVEPKFISQGRLSAFPGRPNVYRATTGNSRNTEEQYDITVIEDRGPRR